MQPRTPHIMARCPTDPLLRLIKTVVRQTSTLVSTHQNIQRKDLMGVLLLLPSNQILMAVSLACPNKLTVKMHQQLPEHLMEPCLPYGLR